jgi:hypothetical protein
MPETIGSPMLWAGFTAFIVAMLALDLGVLHRDAHEVTVKEAAIWSLVWVALSLAFATGLYFWAGHEYGVQFVTGYLIEKALSVDNVSCSSSCSVLQVPPRLQHRVLFWGSSARSSCARRHSSRRGAHRALRVDHNVFGALPSTPATGCCAAVTTTRRRRISRRIDCSADSCRRRIRIRETRSSSARAGGCWQRRLRRCWS